MEVLKASHTTAAVLIYEPSGRLQKLKANGLLSGGKVLTELFVAVLSIGVLRPLGAECKIQVHFHRSPHCHPRQSKKANRFWNRIKARAAMFSCVPAFSFASHCDSESDSAPVHKQTGRGGEGKSGQKGKRKLRSLTSAAVCRLTEAASCRFQALPFLGTASRSTGTMSVESEIIGEVSREDSRAWLHCKGWHEDREGMVGQVPVWSEQALLNHQVPQPPSLPLLFPPSLLPFFPP
jgi:hypothetical protein